MTLPEQGAPNARLLLGALVAASVLLAGPARGQSVSISETQAFTPNPVYVNSGGGANFLATATPAPGTTITQTNYTWIITERDYRTAANLAWTLTYPNTQFSAGQGATLSSNLATGGYYQFTIKCTVVMTTTTGAHETASQTLLVPDILTVVQINSITGTINSTPSVTIRKPNLANPASRTYTSAAVSAGWQAGGSIVLVENSMTSVPLTLSMLPTDYVPRWVCIPDAAGNPAGSVNLTMGGPTGSTNTVTLNSYGAYTVVCYFDANHDGVFDTTPAPADHGVYWNLVSAQVEFKADGTSAVPTDQSSTVLNGETIQVDGAPGVAGAAQAASLFQISNAGVNGGFPGMLFDGTIWVVGGGPTGTVGTERVFTGWCSNISLNTVTGTFKDPNNNSHTVTEFLPNLDVTNFLNNVHYQGDFITHSALPDADWPALAPVLSATSPLLDATPDGPGIGGNTVCLSQAGGNTTAPDGSGVGIDVRCQAEDAPSDVEPQYDPGFLTFSLTLFTMNLDFFRDRLVVWTGTNTGAPNEAGASLYMVANEIPFEIAETCSSIVWGAGTATSTQQPSAGITKGAEIQYPGGVVKAETVYTETTSPSDMTRIGLFDASH